jgi:hypothetical protein
MSSSHHFLKKIRQCPQGKQEEKIVIEISSEEEEEEEEEDDDNDEGIVLCIKNYNKFMAKRIALKGNKGEKTRTRSKRVCYNCGKNGHFIAQCPYERREEDEN